MNIAVVLAVAAAGYLIGSLSFARIIARVVSPGTDISRISAPIPDTDEVFESDAVSATAVRMHLGTRYGCLTGALDMLKAAVPVLMLKLWFPGHPYDALAAASVMAGHIWPAYYGFKGGRGEATLYGGLLVIDFPGVLAVTAGASLLGLCAGSILALRWAGVVLMIPWLWVSTRSWYLLAYIILANAMYWYAMLPELRQYARFLKKGISMSQEEIAVFFGMGARLGRFLDRYNPAAVAVRLRRAARQRR